MAWDDDLTDEQKKVTKYTDTNACLLAGPGTGKTRCITQRVVYLIEELGVPPEKILILTFTRKAASELRQRVTKALGQFNGANIFTLHSYALTQLLKNSSSHSLPKPLRIADDYEESEIILNDLKRILDYDMDTVKEKLKDMSSDWEQLGCSDPERMPDPKFISAWNTHRILFGYTLRAELVYQLNKAYEEHSILPDSYEHIIVDEYQDLNPCELKVVKSLALNGGKLYAAGDDDQSIYSFRNANPEAIRTFTSDYPGSKELILTECMRSTPEIVLLGDYVIRQDLKRKDKETFTNKKSIKDSVNILWFNDQKAEAKNVSKICSWLLREKGIDPKDIIILLRNNSDNKFSKPIIEEMAKLEVPVTETTALTDIFNVPNNLPSDQKKLGRIFLNYLKLLYNSEDHLAWRSLFELKKNGIGKNTISEITKYSEENEVSFYQTIKLIESGVENITKNKRKVSGFIESVEKVLKTHTEDPSVSTNDMIKNLANQVIQDEHFRNRVIETLYSYYDNEATPKLEEMLKNIFIEDTDLNQDQPVNKVRIMTMHQAKGLDAKLVIIVGAENELIPGRDSGDKLYDALRLLYVSVTRARDYLLITHCSYRRGPQGHSGTGIPNVKRNLTRFISGGPIKPDLGVNFVDSMTSTKISTDFHLDD
jgi:DNA helicase-2/ATP-dependent DNA helicase PcrA